MGTFLASPFAPFLGVALLLAALPLGSAVRDRVVPLVLALLWAGQAWGVIGGTGGWPSSLATAALGVLCATEAALLLLQGLVAKEMEFRPRGRARTALGALLLLAVVGGTVFDALRAADGSGALLGWSRFPVAEVTLAVLLLAAVPRRQALPAALVPLLLAATARLGLDPPATLPAAVGLAGFVAGLVALDPGWDREPERVPGEHVLDALRRGGRLAWCLWTAALALGLVTLALRLPVPGLQAVSETVRHALPRIAISLAAGVTLAGWAWLRLPAWRSPGFRWLALESARGIGAVRRWLDRGWHTPMVIAVAGFVAIAALVARPGPVAALLSRWPDDAGVRAVAAVAVLLTMLALVIHWLRRRIFIAEIVTKEDTDDKDRGKRLSARLRNELSSIASLYRTIDEALPERAGSSVRLELAVDDVAGDLEKAVGEEISSAAPLVKIPFSGLLTKIVGLWRGPRLTGTLHEEGPEDERRLALTADVSGGGRRGSWRVSQDDLKDAGKGADRETVAHALVRQLAFRIVASLTSAGSPRWEAVRSFTQGLRAYRAVQRTGADYEIELRQAERFFMESLRLDRHFARCHYNLGIVYTRLGDHAAAEAAFREAVAADPDQAHAYLGLADLYRNRGDTLRAEILATQALALDPGAPHAWNLRGVAKGTALLHRTERDPDASIGPEDWRRVWNVFEAAAAVAWKRLCRQELRGSEAGCKEAASYLALCLYNLARTHLARGAPLAARPVLREAFRVEPRAPYLHLMEGRCLAAAWAEGPPDPERLREARSSLYRAGDDGLDFTERALRWAWLLQVHTALLQAEEDATELSKDEEGQERAFHCFLDAVVPPESLVLAPSPSAAERIRRRYLDRLKEVRSDLEDVVARSPASARRELTRLENLVEIVRSIEDDPPRSEGKVESRGRVLKKHRPWVEAQWRIRMARQALEDGADPGPGTDGSAAVWLEEAVDRLQEDHRRQVKRQGLESLLACAHLACAERLPAGDPQRLEHLREAVENAGRGVAARPVSPHRRLILSQVHSALEDHALADRERATALNFGFSVDLCGNEQILARIETGWREQLEAAKDGAERERIVAQTRCFLERLLGAVESAPAPDGPEPAHGARQDGRFGDHAAVHLALGRLAIAGGDWREAVPHLRIARACDHELEEASLLLGRALAELGALKGAAAAYQGVIDREGQAPRAPSPLQLAEAELRLAILRLRAGSNESAAGALVRRAKDRLKASEAGGPNRLRALLAASEGELDLRGGRPAEAARHLVRALAEEPSLGVYTRLVEVHLGRARTDGSAKAREDAEQALAWARAWCGGTPLPEPLKGFEVELRTLSGKPAEVED